MSLASLERSLDRLEDAIVAPDPPSKECRYERMGTEGSFGMRSHFRWGPPLAKFADSTGLSWRYQRPTAALLATGESDSGSDSTGGTG